MNTILSRHAETRAQQRGIRESDIALIVAVGTPVDDDSIFLKERDVEREIQQHKRIISKLERLSGCRVVLGGETVVTVYRPSRKTERRLLRGQHRHQTITAGDDFPALSIYEGGHSDAS
ncbi:MAG TPA: hypothetical protein PK018_00240 [Candidatus Competibacter sp.]|nr:hypothetical protein [Candidatus Competibacteraceae bacterium]HPE70593.1 hypothetical protein [Candidatus Competibacter sp.]HRX70578.1 hypothetical protein [Candidatus Competibacteraceae bacterium]